MRILLICPLLLMCLNFWGAFGAESSEISNQTGFINQYEDSAEDSVVKTLSYHLTTHPYSHYLDVYKSFMQDYLGPGHIQIDPVKSEAYLLQELNDTSDFKGPLFEPTGYEGNFVRVNLSLIRDGIIPIDTFFEAFIESANGIMAPDEEILKRKWNFVDSCMIKNDIHFRNEQQDREEVRIRFLKKDYVVHHSREFNDSSNYHYRIMSRDVFNKKIKPLIPLSSCR